MHGVLDQTHQSSKGKTIVISKKAHERQAANMLEAVESNHQEYLEVTIEFI